jgi:MFS family permease
MEARMTQLEAARPRSTTALGALLQGVGGGLGWSLLPPLMAQIAGELHISHAEAGLVWGAAPLGIALASPIGGAAVDRFGPRRVAGLAMLAGALACAARALCTSPLALGLAMFAFGLHVAFVAPSIPKALATHVQPAHLARANGVALVAYTFGTAITILVARTVLVPLFGGWRPVMVAGGAAMGMAGLLWLALARDRGALAGHASLGEVFSLAKNGELRRVASMQLLLFGGYLALLGLLPRALVEAGLPPANAGIAVALWLFAAGVANWVGPWASDRWGKRRPLIVGGAIVAGSALAFAAGMPAEYTPIALAISALGGGSFAALLFTLPLEIDGVGPRRAGEAIALLMLFGQAGGFILPIAAGAAADAGGLPLALGFLALIHLAIVFPARSMKETGRSARDLPLGEKGSVAA